MIPFLPVCLAYSIEKSKGIFAFLSWVVRLEILRPKVCN
ncbi:hypothetical protein LEP1GSC037_1812 [Leptospira interrogans str. 2006001854]|uniref:Uncharacterized protein n=1 Tax=Leptospira interrogans str. 2006001854 TaxID=1001590 RepID=M6GCU1_LEPIR|nr:hypothetical protein LEP1GSC037_1812 [Leptospira interrogans str. 2006001854]